METCSRPARPPLRRQDRRRRRRRGQCGVLTWTLLLATASTMWNGRLYSRQMSVISPRLSRRGANGKRAASARLGPQRADVARSAKGPRGTAALAKTIDLLDRVAMAEAPPTFAALVAATGLPRGTLHRLLAALIEHRLVEAPDDDRRYVVGTHLLELARRSWERSDLRRAAAEAIAELHR